ncbi:hypothetical protein [Dyadobacter tibetensis]|uniref:hypothetical protein n=1 Tax=Dyadobacter tibetensis TaxID=1211851 RepID=UPI000470223C|nr:hypothetical protein [Dyadobacter tibetensis]
MNFTLRLLLISILFAGCQGSGNNDSIPIVTLDQLQDGQGRVDITIGENLFYADSSIFQGSTSISHGTMAVNLKDQSEGQIILSFQLPSDLPKRPWIHSLNERDQRSGSLLVGKIIDKSARKGLGYVMTQGQITVARFDQQALIISVVGMAGKYGAEGLSTQKIPVEGSITIKKPVVALDDLTWKDLLP